MKNRQAPAPDQLQRRIQQSHVLGRGQDDVRHLGHHIGADTPGIAVFQDLIPALPRHVVDDHGIMPLNSLAELTKIRPDGDDLRDSVLVRPGIHLKLQIQGTLIIVDEQHIPGHIEGMVDPGKN